MLIKKDLLEAVDEQYRPMLKEVSIPDFTKCIAQFSGLHISKVADSAIEKYLMKWAKNKYRFYKLLGNRLRYDTKIIYKEDIEAKNNRIEKFHELAKEFPTYALWLNEFERSEFNKIESYNLSYCLEDTLRELFPNRSFIGISLTHFFKKYLLAPDDFVTKLGRLFENQEIEANYTISIDPIDIMLASENPYNWTSCYRLENDESSHADGNLAALIDDSSLITYIWNKEGDFSLYNNYDFKHLRYKKMREYISVSPSMNAIHFNSIYPGKNYPDEFEKTLRTIVENLIDKDAVWVKNTSLNISDCNRKYFYGYGEFYYYNIYIKKGSKKEDWKVYNENIICPCGCGVVLPESENDEDIWYNGEGFTVENTFNRHYCDIMDGYCDDYWGDCTGCPVWNRENAVCELDETHYCEFDTWNAEESGIFDPYENNIIHCNSKYCHSCPLYELHHQEENAEMAV